MTGIPMKMCLTVKFPDSTWLNNNVILHLKQKTIHDTFNCSFCVFYQRGEVNKNIGFWFQKG